MKRRGGSERSQGHATLAWLALSFALVALSCRTPRTEILVRVETDLRWGVGETIESVHVVVRADSATGDVRDEFDVPVGTGPGRSAFPLSFGMIPRPGEAARVVYVEVQGCTANGCVATDGGRGDPPIVVDRGVVRYRSQQDRTLVLMLARACAGSRCEAPQRCEPATRLCVAPADVSDDPDAATDADASLVPDFTNVAAGEGYTCGVTSDGGVTCWGSRAPGRAEVSGLEDRGEDFPIEGLHGAIDVTAGFVHACARLSDSTVRCWGRNTAGQLAIDETASNTVYRPRPVVSNEDPTEPIANISQVVATALNTCILTSDGSIRCAGSNHDGRVGIGGITTDRPTPFPIATDHHDFVSLSGDVSNVCALRANGAAQCWGTDHATPTDEAGVVSAMQIARGGNHGCFVDRDEHLSCWGSGRFGEAGTSSSGGLLPSRMPNLDRVLDVTTGAYHSCARLEDGSAWCWGRNDLGQLGDGTLEDRSLAVRVHDLDKVLEIRAGGDHTCARTRNDGLRCWGSDEHGELGRARVLASSMPLVSTAPGGVLAAGTHSFCSLNDGRVACWGETLPARTSELSLENHRVTGPPALVAGLPVGVQDVSLGGSFGCALLADGTISCWGLDDLGQLGDEPGQSRSTPRRVEGISDAIAVAAGDSFACALARSGVVSCWGSNWAGQCGGVFAQSTAGPVTVRTPPDDPIVEISLGLYFSCGRGRSGRVYCWGLDDIGELGDGAHLNRTDAQPVIGVSDAIQIAAGDFHACALLRGGALWCWGANGHLQTGREGGFSLPPGPVPLPMAAAEVAASSVASCARLENGDVVCWGGNEDFSRGDTDLDHPTRATPGDSILHNATLLSIAGRRGCALRTPDGGGDPELFCWGRNIEGALGDGTLEARAAPTRVAASLSNIVAVRTSPTSTCALTGDSRVWCWGLAQFGSLGDGRSPPTFGVVPIDDAAGSERIHAGVLDTCFIAGGVARCAGANLYGLLGADQPAVVTTPVALPLTDVVDVVPGVGHYCARLTGGRLVCWGLNAWGEVGNGTASPAPLPSAVVLPDGWNAIDVGVGYAYSCALLEDSQHLEHAVYCWGLNRAGQLGGWSGTASDLPVRVIGLTSPVALAVGPAHACAVERDGRLLCWGDNSNGQLGIGTSLATAMPVEAQALSGALDDVVSVACSSNTTCVLRSDGLVWCFGGNDWEIFGFSGQFSYVATRPVPELVNVTSIATSEVATMCAISSNDGGTVVCWGANFFGQSGVDQLQGRSGLHPVGPLEAPVQITVGNTHSCALMRSGAVSCWGADIFGQFGVGHSGLELTPVALSGNNSVTEITSGQSHTCVTTNDGKVYCWGDNRVGSIGPAPMRDRLPATEVVLPVATLARGTRATTDATISAGTEHTCAVGVDHGVYCWGQQRSGRLGAQPRAFGEAVRAGGPGFGGIVSVSAGDAYNCALDDAGSVWCWGDNAHGQLGLESSMSTSRTTPVRVTGATNVRQIVSGSSFACALHDGGRVSCWGDNRSGQLGRDAAGLPESSAPVDVPGLNDAVFIAASRVRVCGRNDVGLEVCRSDGSDHVCVIRATGGVRCWGDDSAGQLGAARTAGQTFVDVPELAGVRSIALASHSTCATLADGSSRCWGDNTYGQLADGTLPFSSTPVATGVMNR